MFEVDLGKIKLKWRGAYVNTTAYEVDDVVSYSGSSFICKANTTGVAPTSSANPFWDVLALGSDLGSVATNAGDIFYYNGSAFVNLGAGTQGQVLVQGGLNTPQWQSVDTLSPVIQTRQFIDYTRAAIGNGGYWYLGQTATALSITPRKFNSLITVHGEFYSEVTDHDAAYRIQYSTDGGTTWSNMRAGTSYNQYGHGKWNAYESDFNSTPGHSSFSITQAFSTLNAISFRVYTFNGGTVYVNGAVSSTYEHAQSSMTFTELNADYSSVTYNGGA